MAAVIRLARLTDLSAIAEIERSASSLFDGLVDLPPGAEDAPPDAWAPAIQAGGTWVTEDAGGPFAFAACERFDDGLHVWELDVRRDRQRQGHGRRLIVHAIKAARATAAPRVTLTTFRHIPWNAPFYGSLGFAILPPDQIDPRLAAVLAAEAARGHDPQARCAMSLPLAGKRPDR